jgi:hypothetical protein
LTGVWDWYVNPEMVGLIADKLVTPSATIVDRIPLGGTVRGRLYLQILFECSFSLGGFR